MKRISKKFLIILNVFSNKKILKFNIMPESDFYIDYASLDDFQRLLIDKKNNRSMVVTGSAGSGKW